MLIYITGGARSGKSRYALDLARKRSKTVTFVATCLPTRDRDMQSRIARHRQERPTHWRTIENPKSLSDIFRSPTSVILLDCMTMFVSAKLMQRVPEQTISEQVEEFARTAASRRGITIVVSNEVGCGVVPATRLGIAFCDAAGRANQLLARHAQQVIWMISGIPVSIKGKKI
jgi:adenosylcobinamide kinase/adenosylcobinamide-phosphate guanylyltransferase